MDIEALAAQLVDLRERRDLLNAHIEDVEAQLFDAVEVGGIISVGDKDIFRVTQSHRFNENVARANLPAEILAAVTIPTETLDRTKLAAVLAPDAYERLCTKPSKPSIQVIR